MIILSLTILYEIDDIHRFSDVGKFISYCQLVKCSHESEFLFQDFSDMEEYRGARFRRYQSLLRRGFLHPLILDMLTKYGLCIRRGFFPKTFSFTNIHFMLCKIFQIDF